MTQSQVKNEIKKMKSFDIDKLNTMANKCETPLSIVAFWYEAIHS